MRSECRRVYVEYCTISTRGLWSHSRANQPEKCSAPDSSAFYFFGLPAWKYSMELTGPARRKPSSP